VAAADSSLQMALAAPLLARDPRDSRNQLAGSSGSLQWRPESAPTIQLVGAILSTQIRASSAKFRTRQ
jgi:hypothetical protein